MADGDYLAAIPHVRYEGADSMNPLAFKYYEANRMVLGRPMKVCVDG